MSDDQPTGNPWMKNLLVWGGIFLALALVVSMFNARGEVAATQISYSDFKNIDTTSASARKIPPQTRRFFIQGLPVG